METINFRFRLKKDEVDRYRTSRIVKEGDDIVVIVALNDKILDGEIVVCSTSDKSQHFIGVKGFIDSPSLAKGLCGYVDFTFEPKFNWAYKNERLATEEEIELYNKILLEHGWKYTKEKGFTKIRPRAKEGERYYYIDDILEISYNIDYREATDDELYNAGNYSLTEEGLKDKLERIKEIMKE